jgi:hypothetical protein
MKGEGYPCSREEQIVLVERWIMVFQKGAECGIHPADLVELIVTFIEVKDLLETAQTEETVLEAKFDEVFKKMEPLTRQIEEKGREKSGGRGSNG